MLERWQDKSEVKGGDNTFQSSHSSFPWCWQRKETWHMLFHPFCILMGDEVCADQAPHRMCYKNSRPVVILGDSFLYKIAEFAEEPYLQDVEHMIWWLL